MKEFRWYIDKINNRIKQALRSPLDLDMGSKNIKSLATPVDTYDAAHKDYVDTLASGVGAVYTVGGSNLPSAKLAHCDYKCNGTDDDVDLQAAIDDAASELAGVLFLGDLTLGDTVEAKGVPLFGMGRGSKLIAKDALNKSLLKYTRDSGPNQHQILMNFEMDGNRSNQTVECTAGVYMDRCDWLYLEGLFIKSIYGKGLYVFGNSGASQPSDENLIRGIKIHSTYAHGFSLEGVGDQIISDIDVFYCGDKGSQAAFMLSGVYNSSFTNLNALTSYGRGIWAYYARGLSINGAYLRNCNMDGVRFDGVTDNKNHGRHMLNHITAHINSQAGAGSYDGIRFSGICFSKLSGCHSYDDSGSKKQRYGIYLDANSNDNIVSDCIALTAESQGADGILDSGARNNVHDCKEV